MAAGSPTNEKFMFVSMPPIKIEKNITLTSICKSGYFSREKSSFGNQDYVVFPDDLRQLRAFNKNHGTKLDLLDGYESTRIPFVDYMPLEEPQGALKEYLAKRGLMDRLKNPNNQMVVSSAGTINELAVIPYTRFPRDHWMMERHLDGVLFISKGPDDDQNQTEKKRREDFQAKRFELHMTNSPLKIDPDECFCAVYQAKLLGEKEFNLVYKCEIDCRDEERRTYVELKTKTKVAFDRKNAKLDFLKWYLQLKFTTIERIECEIRNDMTHRIDQVKTFNQKVLKQEYSKHTEHRPKEQPKFKLFPKNEALKTSGKGCVHFLYKLLTFLDRNVDRGEKWRIGYSPASAQDALGLVILKKSN